MVNKENDLIEKFDDVTERLEKLITKAMLSSGMSELFSMDANEYALVKEGYDLMKQAIDIEKVLIREISLLDDVMNKLNEMEMVNSNNNEYLNERLDRILEKLSKEKKEEKK